MIVGDEYRDHADTITPDCEIYQSQSWDDARISTPQAPFRPDWHSTNGFQVFRAAIIESSPCPRRGADMSSLEFGGWGPDHRRGRARHQFAFYVEGPSDRDILRTWARRLSPRLARSLEPCAVILGGRQPARALKHFRGVQAQDAEARGVCVLDRDDHEPGSIADTSKLQFFTWPRRHIESYLLVPGAIARCTGCEPGDSRTDRILRDHLPDDDDESAFKLIDAKRLLAPTGRLSQALGFSLSVGRVARALRRDELHHDVRRLFDLLGQGLGVPEPRREVVYKR